MSLQEMYELNKRFPIRLCLLKNSIKLNLDYAKKQLYLDARKTKSINLALRLANGDLDDLEYSINKGIVKHLHLEFNPR